MATNLLQGQASEWALLKRHPVEDVFGVQARRAGPNLGSIPDCGARNGSRTRQLLSSLILFERPGSLNLVRSVGSWGMASVCNVFG